MVKMQYLHSLLDNPGHITVSVIWLFSSVGTPALGRITGYAEVYEDLLTEGKAAELGRSHGFFVYVRSRLINLEDALFGLPALRHGTFSRFRGVVHVDRLDDVLRSSRETVLDGPLVLTTRRILHALFNVARVWLEASDAEQKPDQLAVKRISASPGSLTGRPILNVIAGAFEGKYSPRYLRVPPIVSKKEQQAFLERLRERADSDAGLVTSLELVERDQEQGIATLDVQSGVLNINALHPFVAAYRDDYEGRRETLGLLAMADVLTEAYLFQEGIVPTTINDILSRRDDLLRQFARSLPRTAATVAQSLEDASCDESRLERELVACFDSMGFAAVHIGGKGKPDGKADAFLGTQSGRQLSYSVSLESKSKQDSGKAVSAKDIGISAVARHRDDYSCDHAVVVAPEFPTSEGEDSAVIKEARADREACRNRAQSGNGKDASISLVRILDMSRLVRLVSSKFVALDRIREFLASCITPEESGRWIDALQAEAPPKLQIREILETIWEEQKDDVRAEVEFGSVRTALRRSKGISIGTNELATVCNSLAQLTPTLISVRPGFVSLRQRPDKVLSAAKEAIPKPRETGSVSMRGRSS